MQTVRSMGADSFREQVVVFLLSFGAGFVDAICYMALFHTFVTFITGTMMILFIDLATATPGAFNKLIVFLAFFVFSIFWIFLMRRLPYPRRFERTIFLAIEAAMIVAFAAVAMALSPLESASSLNTLGVSIAGVFTMTLHSAIFFTLMTGSAPSHLMTGNLTNFCRGVVDIWLTDTLHDPAQRAAARHRVSHFPAVIASFLIGVVLGAFAYEALGFAALLGAAIAIGGAVALAFAVERAAPA